MPEQKTDADDIFQEVFLRYIKNAPAFESEEHCKAWLIRVTINCAKRHFSSPWLKHTAPLEDSIEYSDPAEQGLDEALRRLPQNYRAVIHLFYYEGYSTDEIAKLLSRKPSTIRTQLTRARRLLGDLMEGE